MRARGYLCLRGGYSSSELGSPCYSGCSGGHNVLCTCKHSRHKRDSEPSNARTLFLRPLAAACDRAARRQPCLRVKEDYRWRSKDERWLMTSLAWARERRERCTRAAPASSGVPLGSASSSRAVFDRLHRTLQPLNPAIPVITQSHTKHCRAAAQTPNLLLKHFNFFRELARQ